jgi:hypothetical protein
VALGRAPVPRAGSGVSPDPSDNTAILGSKLSGANITLATAGDMAIETSLVGHGMDSENQNLGWEAGVAIDVGQAGGIRAKIRGQN